MNATKTILVGILGGTVFFVIVIFVINHYIDQRKQREIESRPFLNELKSHDEWHITKITGKNVLSQFNDDESFPNPNAYNRDYPINWGPIFYDSIRKNIWVEITSLNTTVSHGVANEDKEWICFDTSGNIIKQNNTDLSKIPVISLPEIGIESIFSDSSAQFFVEKYIKQKNIWNSLNPLRGMGNPNGNSQNLYSDGIAFVNLTLKNDTIKFKAAAEKGENGLNIKLTLFALNMRDLSKNSYIILVSQRYMEEGLYLINTNYR